MASKQHFPPKDTIPVVPSSSEALGPLLTSLLLGGSKNNKKAHKGESLVLPGEKKNKQYVSWLAERMHQYTSMAGVHSALSTMFHLGRFSDSPVAARLWSTICVTEFLSRFFPRQNVKDEYAMKCIFEAKGPHDNMFTAFEPGMDWWRFVKEQYVQLRDDLFHIEGSLIPLFTTYQRSLNLSRKVVLRLASVCKSLSVDPSLVTPMFVSAQMPVLRELLKGVSKNDLEKKVDILISERTMRAAFRGMDLSWVKKVDSADSRDDKPGTGELCNGVRMDDGLLPRNNAVVTGLGDDNKVIAGQEEDTANPLGSNDTTTVDDRISGLEGDDAAALGVEEIQPTKKRRGVGGLAIGTGNNGPEPRRQLPRRGGVPGNPVHFEEDAHIPSRADVLVSIKPSGCDTTLVVSPRPPPGTSWEGSMFDERAKRFDPPLSILPTIFMESFRGKDNRLVAGPYKYRDGKEKKAYRIGCDNYLHTNGESRLAEVLCCNTTRAYVYFFKHANLRPHFVVGKEEATKYRKKLEGLDVDVRIIPRWKLEKPVKVVTDQSLVSGLRAGAEEESDFTFVSEETDLFRQYFGELDQIPFPTSQWMEFLDGKTSDLDRHGRNFKFGHHDCGFGREGVAANAHVTQDAGIGFVLGKPQLIGDGRMMSTLGPIVDRTTLLMDAVCFEDGYRLMNDVARDGLFGAEMRRKTRSVHSRFEAYTIVRQPLGNARDVLDGNVDFPSTSRHLDGPNCTRPGYTTTAVFSYLCVWKGTAYRTSVIMYTRQSCGNYCWRNYFARILRRKLRDYIVERNGGVHYGDFSLKDSMVETKGEWVGGGDGNNDIFFIRPSAKDLSDTFFDRQPGSRWRHRVEDKTSECLSWRQFDWGGKFHAPLDLFAVPEFFCRFGFVSSFASQINRFVSHGGIPTPNELTHQLLYIALLSSSQIQFYYVLELLMKQKTRLIESYGTAKTASGGKTDVTLFRSYQQICNDRLNSMTGGPYNRFQAQPTRHAIFTDDDSLRENLGKIPKLIDHLEKGKFLGLDGVITKHPGKELAVVGDVASISCAPLVVFVGMAKGEHAINTAKQSLVNTKTGNTYYHSLVSFLDEHDKAVPKTKKDPKYLLRLFRGIAKSWNTVIGSVENGCCAAFRAAKKCDVFFRGQEMYNLDDSSSHVMVKPFGGEAWEVKEF